MASKNGFISRPKVMARKDSPVPLVTGGFSDVECHQKTPHVCAICEEGGNLLFCDGPCMRHFHQSHVSAGAQEYGCPGVDYQCLDGDRWLCPDCNLKQAMCVSCHRVGSFEGIEGAPPEVRQCPDPLCIRFFCFSCLPAERTAYPVHNCLACTDPETENPGGMVYCLRCPRAWHLRCLKKRQASGYLKHREIYCHEWRGQLRNMVYCEQHVIDPHLGTPIRSHVTTAICPTLRDL